MVINKTKMAKGMIYFCIIWSIIVNTLIAEIGFPNAISYLPDICWVVLGLCLLNKGKISISNRYITLSKIIVILYSVSLLIGILINMVSIPLVVWATRNTFRFFVFFYACIRYLDKRDVDKIINAMYYLNIVSFLLAIYQYYVLGYFQDNVGGIFGYGNGAALNTFQALLFAYYFCSYMNSRKGLERFLAVLVTTLFVAAIAEEKAYFLYLIIVVAVYFISNRLNIKTFVIFGVIAVALIYGIQYLYATNEWMGRRMMDWNSAIDYANNAYGISRLDPFGGVNELFFKNNIIDNLFGYGFGSCELSAGNAIINSAFSEQYLYTQYMDFTSQMRFLETGYVGTILYILFFVSILIFAFKQGNKFSADFKIYSKFAYCFTVVVIVTIWMSAALRAKEAYIIFFGLSIIYVIAKENRISRVRKTECTE